MNRSYRQVAKRLAPTTAILVAAGVTAAVHATGASAADSAPALKLAIPTATQTAYRGSAKNSVYLYDLGLFAVANQTVEFRAQRGKSFKDPITGTLSIGDGADKKTTDLPSTLLTSVNNLEKFFAYSVTDKNGTVVKKGSINFCPNSYEAGRARPDATPNNPYPFECGYRPFTKGGVFGIQNGWSVPAFNDWESPPSFKGKDGTYALKIVIRKDWRTALGMTAAQSTANIKLKVVTDADTAGAAARSVTTAAATGHDHHGSSAALAKPATSQEAAMAAARQRALGHPNTPAAKPPTQTAAKRLGAAAVEDLPTPDLQSLPATEIYLNRSAKTKKSYISFSATVWNAGPSPLVVDGFRPEGSDVMDAYQYFFDKDGNQVGYRPAGGLEWDPRTGHNHWHFKAFASYRLLDAETKKARISGKEAFCLAPTDSVNMNVDGAKWRPASTDLYTACGQGNGNLMSIREVLETGWGDTYSQDLPGQAFNITNIPNGVYYIQTLANPDKKLLEGSFTNNSALRKIKIGGKVGGKRTLKVYDYQGIKTQ